MSRNAFGFTCLLGLLLFHSPSDVDAQTPPDARQIVKRVSDVYQHLASYRSASVFSIETSGAVNDKSSFRVDLVMAAPDKSRSTVTDDRSYIQVVSNGNQSWVYFSDENEYGKINADASAIDPVLRGITSAPEYAGGEVETYKRLYGGLEDAVLAGGETLALDGKPFECYKLDIKTRRLSENSAVRSYRWTIWVDRTSYLVLKDNMLWIMEWPKSSGAQISFNETVTVSSVGMNLPVPDSLFRFTPPAGARERKPEMDDSEQRSVDVDKPQTDDEESHSAEMVGREAVDFTLNDLLGRPRELNALRGKVVLLYFWASFCLPCAVELPQLDKLAREFKDKGLVVIGISEMDSATKAMQFLKSHRIAITVLTDSEGAARESYHIRSVPTLVVIGRDGLITSYHEGAQSEAALRSQLAGAGFR